MKNEYASETERKLTNNPILLALAALWLCVCSAVAPAAACIPTTTWNYAGSGSWFDSTKWSSGVPDSTKDAFINNGGTAEVNSTGAQACNLTLGYAAAESGKVSVAGGSLAVTNEVEVGAYGKGTLTITNGETVSAGLLTIAALQGTSDSVGTVTVDGGTFTINTRADVAGDNGTTGGIGLMTVKNGGSVTAGNLRVYTSDTLTGNGSVSATNGTTIQGTLTPSGGTLTIEGDLTFSGTVATMECRVVPASADNVNVSGVASLAGKISVTMTGSTFTAGTTYTLLHAAGGFDPNHHMFRYMSIKPGTGDCFTPVITYDTNNNNVNLYLSPCSN